MLRISDKTQGYLLQMVPLAIACFSIICITLLCPYKWLMVVLQCPIWLIIFWWWHMQEVYFRELPFRRDTVRESEKLMSDSDPGRYKL